MKALLYLIAIVVVASGCMTTKIHQHNIPCHSRTKADVVRAAMSLLVQNGFTITLADTVVGLVQGETEGSVSIWTGATSKRVWQVSIRPELGPIGKVESGDQAALSAPPPTGPLFIIATAKTVDKTTNAYGATTATGEVYYDDKAHEDWQWYWDVRKGLEGICGAKAVISTKKMN